MGLKLAFIFAFVLMLPVAQAQQIALLTDGTCEEYNVTIRLNDFEDGHYDIKIDALNSDGRRVGEIYDPLKGWKSSYFYVTDAMFVQGEDNYGNFNIRADTHKNFNITISAKSQSTVWTSDSYEVKQDCPETEITEPPFFFLGLMVAVLLLVVAVALHTKKFD
jgi:hypothetical protein